MEPKTVASELSLLSSRIRDVLYFPMNDDTVLVIPESSPVSRQIVELTGYKIRADEVDYMKPEEALELLELQEPLPPEERDEFLIATKGIKEILRLWWD